MVKQVLIFQLENIILMKVCEFSFKKFNLFIDPERRLECVKNKEQRYWLLLKEYENFIRCDLSLFEAKKEESIK